MIKVIADPGSCHMGNLERALELTRVAAACGCDAIKWQLFRDDSNGNIPLNREWFEALVGSADIEVFASVWDREAIDLLIRCKCKSIKFSYSQSQNWFSYPGSQFSHTYVSGDLSTRGWVSRAIKLYCIPLYPVPYLIDFDGLFPRFDGFSSHCLGIEQDKAAIRAGAKIIEKHFQLDDVSACPDGNFAIRPAKLKELCDYAHAYEGLMQ